MKELQAVETRTFMELLYCPHCQNNFFPIFQFMDNEKGGEWRICNGCVSRIPPTYKDVNLLDILKTFYPKQKCQAM